MHQTSPAPSRLFEWIGDHTRETVLAVVTVIGLLVIPFLAMTPTESASTEPGGAVFDARDRIDERFASSVHPVFFVAEDDGGDLLRAEPLRELAAASDRLRTDPEIGPTLFGFFNDEVLMQVDGVFSLADLIDAELTSRGTALSVADDAAVKEAGAALIDRYGEDNPVLGLSTETTRSATGEWVVPAVLFNTYSDDTILGFGNTSVNLGGGTEVEEYDRQVRDLLRTADGVDIQGVAIDVNLTSQEQGAVAGPFIGLTVLAALLLVGVTFRSYWVLATVSVAFLMLLIWLKGISNLIGLKDDLVLSLIVPIAMVSFGVDFAFHAVGRYREERAEGHPARRAAVVGTAAVSGALLLAMFSDAAAFLANTTAGIESVVQFGIGAAIALVGADLLLGIVTPYVVAWIEANVGAPAEGRRSTALRVAGAFVAAAMTMASTLFLVFLAPLVGVALTAVTALAALVVPALVQARRRRGPAIGTLPVKAAASGVAARIGAVVTRIAEARRLVLPGAVVVTAVALVFALQVPTRFEVEDFFSSDTDFVQSLQQLDRHVGERGGEPASILVEGDLTDPVALAGLQAHVDELRQLDDAPFVQLDGATRVDAGILDVLDTALGSAPFAAVLAEQTGVELTDADRDRIPDTPSQVRATIELASTIGVPFDAERLSLTPDDVRTAVDLGADGEPDATVFQLEIVNSQSQQSVQAARDALTPITEGMSDTLGGAFVQATGSALVREGSLEGTSRALLVSLPVAVLACLTVASTFLRSIRYGLASIVPILMVVAWLYALMEIAGFAINLVTATIAAVSIGIGIDFALHYIARFREELARFGDRMAAIRVASEGTGLALVASAASSAVGFGILAFAPMPLFATYGMLTAAMIVMALAATLIVLPALLVAITPARAFNSQVGGGSGVAAAPTVANGPAPAAVVDAEVLLPV